MQQNNPVNDSSSLSNEDVIGENQKLLILHKVFNELTDKENSENEEEKKK